MAKIPHNLQQCFIFAAGRGERMKPLTDSIPKPLVKIHHQPILQHILDKILPITSLNKIIINAFYLAEQIEEFTNQINDSRLIVSRETFKIETGGGLLYAADLIDFNQPLLVINGDILWQQNKLNDIEQLWQRWQKNDCNILLGLKKKDELIGYEGKGDFDYNPQDNSLNSKNSNRNYAYVGVQIINPQILNNSPIIPFSINHFYKSSTDENGLLSQIKGIELDGKFFHIGTTTMVDQLNNNS